MSQQDNVYHLCGNIALLVVIFQLLMEHVNFECMEESVLHAISLGLRNMVRLIIDHPNYLAGQRAAGGMHATSIT